MCPSRAAYSICHHAAHHSPCLEITLVPPGAEAHLARWCESAEELFNWPRDGGHCALRYAPRLHLQLFSFRRSLALFKIWERRVRIVGAIGFKQSRRDRIRCNDTSQESAGLFKRSAEDVPELASTDPSPGEGVVQRAGCELKKIFPSTKSIGFCHLWVGSVFKVGSYKDVCQSPTAEFRRPAPTWCDLNYNGSLVEEEGAYDQHVIGRKSSQKVLVPLCMP